MSSFQTQFPLSPKKFWKKIIEKFWGYVILTILLAFGIAYIMQLISIDNDASINYSNILYTTLMLVVSASFLAIIPYAIYIKVYIKRYKGGDQFITIKKGVFAPTEIHVQYQKIQDVYVDQDILDRIMGLYDVHIASATVTSGIEAHIDGVEHEVAEGLKSFLLGKIGGNTNSNQPLNTITANDLSPSTSIKFEEKISSDTFPINTRWVVATVLKTALNSFIFPLVIVGMLYDKKSSIPEHNDFFLVLTSHLMQFFIAYAVIFAGSTIYNLIWKSNFKFDFTPDHILVYEKVLSQSEKHVPYRTVQNVTISQSIIDRMFHIANVVIENASSGQMTTTNRLGSNAILIPGQTPENANKIAEVLKKVILTKNSSQTGL
jgi:putative membrane protein